MDYQRAFDFLNREQIWEELRIRGLPGKYINIIREGYENFSCKVLHEGQLSEPIITSLGVQQGCLLSPLLFLLVMDGVLRKAIDKRKRGIIWNLRETLEDLEYADVCLLSHKHDHAQKKLNDLYEESKRAGLTILQRQKR